MQVPLFALCTLHFAPKNDVMPSREKYAEHNPPEGDHAEQD